MMLKLSDEDRQAFGLLLTPSWLSGLIAIVAGLVVCFGVIIAFSVNNSGLQQQLMAWQDNKAQPALTQPGQNLSEDDRPTLEGSWPLLLLWSFVGLLVYGLVAVIMQNINRAEELRQSLNYVNAQPETTLATTAEHLLLRFIATVVALVFASFLVKQIIPYCITAAHASAADFWSVDGGLYALVSFALIVVAVHIETIFVRLVLGRARVFSA